MTDPMSEWQKAAPVGKHILIVGNHPWTGRTGKIVRWEKIGHLGPFPVVELDYLHQECFVQDRENMAPIEV